MRGNDHWIIAPILARAIQIDLLTMTANFYLLLLKPQVFYLGWIQKQPVVQQLPSVRHTDMAHKAEIAVCGSSIFVCQMTGEAITGCHKQHFGLPGQRSICIDLTRFGVIIQRLLPHITNSYAHNSSSNVAIYIDRQLHAQKGNTMGYTYTSLLLLPLLCKFFSFTLLE